MVALDVTFVPKALRFHLVVELNHFTLNPEEHTSTNADSVGPRDFSAMRGGIGGVDYETTGQFWPAHDALMKHGST
jgi:hypothetical protein